jgi:hypothetical protein
VDEAHSYKNGFVLTKMSNVAGVTTRESGRAADMQMKCDFFNEYFGNGHLMMMTGTPIVNEKSKYIYFDGQAKDLFLGLEKALTIEELNEIYGVEFSLRPRDWELPEWGSGFIHHGVIIHVIHDDKIGPDSHLMLIYYPQGEGRLFEGGYL